MTSANPGAQAARLDVVSLGESMLRLSVPTGRRLEAAEHFDVHVAGAEVNVTAALAGLGRHCGWVSALPDNALGRLVLRQLRAAGVDTAAVRLVPGARLGLYFVEFASPPHSTQVTYDRAHSAAAALTVADVDWDYLLSARILHLTGITPALSGSCLALVADAVQRAHAAGLLVSFDVNYRALLWPPDKAAAALRPLLRQVDILFCGQADAERLFGCAGDEHEMLAGLRALTPAGRIVLTRSSAGSVALDGERFLSQPSLPVQIVDRLGAGDAFAAGVLDGLLDGSLDDGLRRGSALAALALAHHGDILIASRADMETLLEGAARDIVR